MTITPITTMLTKNTAELRVLVQKHVAADQVIQGTYWDPENQRGCFIGCLNHSSDPSGAESRFGLPLMLQRIAESIFEALPAAEAKAFFAALPDAVGCDGKDLSCVGWQFLAAELRSLPEQPAESQAVIDPVITGLELLAAGQEWPVDAARAATAIAVPLVATSWATKATIRATLAAAAAAARAAARAARLATFGAARAFEAAKAAEATGWVFEARAAGRANRDAARQRQRDLLLRLIAEAPVGEEARS